MLVSEQQQNTLGDMHRRGHSSLLGLPLHAKWMSAAKTAAGRLVQVRHRQPWELPRLARNWLGTLASSSRTEVELMLLVTGSVTMCTRSRCCHNREPSFCNRVAASVLSLQRRAKQSPACV